MRKLILIFFQSTSVFQPRGRNILGVGDFARHDWMWFFTLNYANGPGQKDHVNQDGSRRNPRGQNYMEPQFRQPATVYKEEETHSGEDVGVYASGPYAHVRKLPKNFDFQLV